MIPLNLNTHCQVFISVTHSQVSNLGCVCSYSNWFCIIYKKKKKEKQDYLCLIKQKQTNKLKYLTVRTH